MADETSPGRAARRRSLRRPVWRGDAAALAEVAVPALVAEAVAAGFCGDCLAPLGGRRGNYCRACGCWWFLALPRPAGA